MLRTYGSEDCEGKETTLDVVPVVGEVFRDDVDPGVLSIATHLLVLSQGIRHLLQHKLSEAKAEPQTKKVVETDSKFTSTVWKEKGQNKKYFLQNLLLLVCFVQQEGFEQKKT